MRQLRVHAFGDRSTNAQDYSKCDSAFVHLDQPLGHVLSWYFERYEQFFLRIYEYEGIANRVLLPSDTARCLDLPEQITFICAKRANLRAGTSAAVNTEQQH